MKRSLSSILVLCDLDRLLLNDNGNLSAVTRDVLQLFVGRGGRLTVFSQLPPKAVQTALGSLRLSAPVLVCGGTLACSFAEGTSQPLSTFIGKEDSVLSHLPCEAGVGVSLQMSDGSTRVLRMSETLELRLRQERTPYVLSSASDLHGDGVLRILLDRDAQHAPLRPLLSKALGSSLDTLRMDHIGQDTLVLTAGEVSGATMFNAVCPPVGCTEQQLFVMADCGQLLPLIQLAGQSAVPADAAAELRLAASQVALTDHNSGAAAEILYQLVRSAEVTA